MAFSSSNGQKPKFISNLSITMDYDSGYMSQNPESNLDSSMDLNTAGGTVNSECKPIYWSEDALLEKPEVQTNYLNLAAEVENENYEETRRLFYSPDKDSSEEQISNSVVSQETTYSVFNDSEIEASPIINPIKPIVADSVMLRNALNCIYNDNDQENIYYNTIDSRNNFSGKLDKMDTIVKPPVLTNITNTLVTNDPIKKLTLVFSRDDKENNYSVKRKYCSLTPEKQTSFEKSRSGINSSLEESFISEKNTSSENNMSKNSNKRSTSSNDSMEIEETLAAPIIVSFQNSKVEPENVFVNKENEIIKSTQSEQLENKDNITNRGIIKTDYETNVTEISYDCNVKLFSTLPEKDVRIYTNISEVLEEKSNIVNNSMPHTEGNICNIEVENNAITIGSQTADNNISNILNLPVPCSVANKIDLAVVHGNSCSNLANEEVLQQIQQTETLELVDIPKFLINSEIENSNDVSSTLFVNASLSATPQKKFVNPVDPNVSPDLFEDEIEAERTSEKTLISNSIQKERFINKKDYSLIKRASNSLSGVLPPHSVTMTQMSVDEMLNKIEANKDYFWCKKDEEPKVSSSDTSMQSLDNNDGFKSLLISEPLEKCLEKKWPCILEGRFHGMHFNRSRLSEQFEDLCSKYAQRYVGAETHSSCTVFEVTNTSPMKRKQIKRWNLKSPGRRLSHLARRRITFSSSNLQNSSFAGSRARQILVDAKKLDLLRRKSPRKSPRKTPKKSPRPKTRTPSSSAKKKLALRFRKLTGEIETTTTSTSKLSSKRALFQSPDRDPKTFFPSTSGTSAFKAEGIKPTKRALFISPSKNSPLKNLPFKISPLKKLELNMERKRKRSESDDHEISKFPRTMSDFRPSESEVSSFSRYKSELNISSSQGSLTELSAAHKKKLQWAIYEALRAQGISPSHAQFKVLASILARVTRRILPTYTSGIAGKEMGTSERMLRIARYHVHAVIKGKSVDEIVGEFMRNRLKHVKPQGYIGIEEFSSGRKRDNVLQDRSNTLNSLEKRKLEISNKLNTSGNINVDRIRKVINFGDDNR